MKLGNSYTFDKVKSSYKDKQEDIREKFFSSFISNLIFSLFSSQGQKSLIGETDREVS